MPLSMRISKLISASSESQSKQIKSIRSYKYQINVIGPTNWIANKWSQRLVVRTVIYEIDRETTEQERKIHNFFSLPPVV